MAIRINRTALLDDPRLAFVRRGAVEMRAILTRMRERHAASVAWLEHPAARHLGPASIRAAVLSPLRDAMRDADQLRRTMDGFLTVVLELGVLEHLGPRLSTALREARAAESPAEWPAGLMSSDQVRAISSEIWPDPLPELDWGAIALDGFDYDEVAHVLRRSTPRGTTAVRLCRPRLDAPEPSTHRTLAGVRPSFGRPAESHLRSDDLRALADTACRRLYQQHVAVVRELEDVGVPRSRGGNPLLFEIFFGLLAVGIALAIICAILHGSGEEDAGEGVCAAGGAVMVLSLITLFVALSTAASSSSSSVQLVPHSQAAS